MGIGKREMLYFALAAVHYLGKMHVEIFNAVVAELGYHVFEAGPVVGLGPEAAALALTVLSACLLYVAVLRLLGVRLLRYLSRRIERPPLPRLCMW